VRLDPQVDRPEKAVVLITVDGFGADKFGEFLDRGDLPNIQRLLVDRGVRVRRAVTSQPCITYANLVTLLTGRHPGHHGILGNKWFDRYALVYRDYTTVATYRLVDDDFTAPTLFERIDPAPSASIQCAARRGATRQIDNWASSGIRWFFGAQQDVDRLIPLRLELIANSAHRWGRWPAIIHAYFPALDDIGHRRGCDSGEYREAAINVDRQIGRLYAAVDAAGMAELTYFVLLSDHGHVPVPPDRFFDVADYLGREMGLRIRQQPTGITALARRQRHYAAIDAVVVVGGDRRAVIHLPGPAGWYQRPDFVQVMAVLDPPDTDREPLWMQPAVQMALLPRRGSDGSTTIELYSPLGRCRLRRRWVGGTVQYGYEIVTSDALAGAIQPGWHDAETWLAITVDGPFPDLVVQMVELFDSPRAGDVMLIARRGWDFARGDRGGHGGVLAREMLVPLVLAGPGIPGGQTIERARLVDVAPTLLRLLSGPDDAPDHGTFDGVDRSEALLSADSVQDAIE
jgi:arylsulfatase A-like enzyme